MKAKTIKGILHKKFNEFSDSITDERVRKLVQENSIITGGCIASLLLNEKVNDFDIYFANFETAEAVTSYYVQAFKEKNSYNSDIEMTIDESKVENPRIKIKVKSSGIATADDSQVQSADDYMQKREAENTNDDGEYVQEEETEEQKKAKYEVQFMTSNAISLSGKIQLIIRFYGTPEEIHKNYDFSHCTNYWYSKTNDLVLHKAALECLLSKELRYQGSKYPLCSIFRIRKFIARGWTINAGQILKMALQLNKLDLEDINVLEDQLVGVDNAFFVSLLCSIRAANNKKINDTMTEEQKDKIRNRVDSSYLVELIDKLF